jgi:hypothetical protein
MYQMNRGKSEGSGKTRGKRKNKRLKMVIIL